ncbi:hypothetical protein 2011_scaffold3_00082 [Bacteriophage sp.]|nr:hypothetical protein 2011_scaffold3_00082 [Bacteriophage sp.]
MHRCSGLLSFSSLFSAYAPFSAGCKMSRKLQCNRERNL